MLKRLATTGISWGFALLGVQAGYIDPNWPLVVGVFVAALILGIVAEMRGHGVRE